MKTLKITDLNCNDLELNQEEIDNNILSAVFTITDEDNCCFVSITDEEDLRVLEQWIYEIRQNIIKNKRNEAK